MTVRDRLGPKIAEVKHDLTSWLDQHHPADTVLNTVAAGIALVEMGCDRFLAVHGEDYALDYIQKIFARAVQKRHATVTAKPARRGRRKHA